MRLRVHCRSKQNGRVRLLHHAAAVPDAGGGDVWALLVPCERLISRPAAHVGRPQRRVREWYHLGRTAGAQAALLLV